MTPLSSPTAPRRACTPLFFTLLDTGDEVIVPAPYWVSYTEQIRMVGGVPVIVPTTEAQHFKMTPAQLEAAITDKTKALVLNNPSNPTGMIYSKEELEALAEVCLRHDIYIIADEIFTTASATTDANSPASQHSAKK